MTRAGRAVTYTGFQWRGRTTVGDDEATSLREVMFIDRDWQAVTGRWFTGAYDELGLDVTLTRIGREVLVSGLDRKSVRRGTTGQTLRVLGENLPASVSAADVDLGPGVKITAASVTSPGVVTVTVDTAADAVVGTRDLFLSGAILRGAVAVYDQVDYLKVTPHRTMARVGGVMFP